jgi:hypothetical protein
MVTFYKRKKRNDLRKSGERNNENIFEAFISSSLDEPVDSHGESEDTKLDLTSSSR